MGVIAEGCGRGEGVLTQSQIILAGLIHLSPSKRMKAILQNIREKEGLVLEAFYPTDNHLSKLINPQDNPG